MTRTRTVVLVLAGGTLATGLLAGCATPIGSPASPASSVSVSASAGSTTGAALPGITVTRTGGFAGVNQSLTITAGGAWSYTDKRSGATSTGQFTAAQLTQLATLALDPRLLMEASPAASVCNDAFQYELAVGAVRSTFEDCGQSRPAVQALLSFLTQNTDL